MSYKVCLAHRNENMEPSFKVPGWMIMKQEIMSNEMFRMSLELRVFVVVLCRDYVMFFVFLPSDVWYSSGVCVSYGHAYDYCLTCSYFVFCT